MSAHLAKTVFYIPPKSDRFRMFRGRAQFLYGVGGQHFISDIAKLNPNLCIVKDCRNAARCAWLDEAEKYPDCHNGCATTCLHCEAKNNAEAWRKWCTPGT